MTPPPPSTGEAVAASPAAEAVALPGLSDLQRLRNRGRLRTTLGVLGPAFVACVAYVDPGNFATNIAGGAKYGYLLLWVLLAANLMGMLIQNLSAKIGIATGRNLPELCREHFGRRTSFGLWVQAELIAMATDLAEFVGAAIALNLLFGVPLFHAGLITAVIAFAILALQGRSGRQYRRFELVIGGMLGIILLGFLYDTLSIGFDAGDAAQGFIPGFAGTDSVLLATGILGATVMPHVIYLHSALTQGRIRPRDDEERRALLRFQRVDVTIAMGIAGLVNMSMLIIAASLFNAGGLTGVDTIEGAHAQFEALVGPGAALAFALALLASGLASSSVGTYAGQVVMQGFIARTIPLVLRRAITMAPALIVLASGADPSRALVLSQVVLSFGIPFALVPLVLLTRRREIMGALVNQRRTTVVASVVAALIIALNGFLLYDTVCWASLPGHGHGPRGQLPGARRLVPRRLDRPRARPAHLRRDALRRRGGLPDDVQPAALLEARLALADPRRPPLRPRLRRARRPQRPAPPRPGRHRRRAGPPRAPHRPRVRRPDLGPTGVGAPGARADLPPVAVARVAALVPDLLFGSKVQARSSRPATRSTC